MRYELTDYEWQTIKPFLPNKPRVWTSADAGNHSTKLHRRWFGAPTIVLRENRRSSSLMTVRHFTAQRLPPFGTRDIAQATATLRNFKPVDAADGSFASDQSRKCGLGNRSQPR